MGVSESPGGRPMGAVGITLVTIYLVVVTVVVFHSLVVLWPPNREPTGTSAAAAASTASAAAPDPTLCEDGRQRKAELFWSFTLCLSDEERLFLVVMFSGALGGLVHSLRSFYWYAGNRKLVLSWAGFYVTLPVLGATLATVFYLVVRGGFFSPQSEISDTSPFGFAALAALIGMFTEQAAEKLKDITETLFARAPKGTDQAEPKAAAPTVSAVSPAQGPLAAATAVTVTGSSFAQGAAVTFGGKAAANVQVAADGASLAADTPAGDALKAVDVEVTNPDGKKGALAGGFTYV